MGGGIRDETTLKVLLYVTPEHLEDIPDPISLLIGRESRVNVGGRCVRCRNCGSTGHLRFFYTKYLKAMSK